MAEAGRGAGPRPRGGRRSRARQASPRRVRDTVFVDLVSDSDEEILEVATIRTSVEVLPPAPTAPAAPPRDSDSDSEGSEAPRTLVRRRRRRLLLDPGEAPVVPVYSGKVQSSLNLIPDNASLLKLYSEEAEDEADMTDSSCLPPEDSPLPDSPWKKKLRNNEKKEKKKGKFSDQDISPLPQSSSRSKSRKHSEALQKLREVNKRLQNLRSCLSPKQQCQGPALQNEDDEVVLVEGPVLQHSPRLLQLKIRCRADLIRLPVRMSDPLQNAVDHMAVRLGVSPSRILLLFGETELSPTATPRTLKLGVADIIDCVVLASSSEATETSQLLQLRVQGKEKHQMLEITLSPDSPLKILMSQYEEAMGLSGHKLSFFFDGTKLSGKELPVDLGMESGDLIEVWG
uniref:NFATC2-interacting protein n=1 Tax=Jaculus jaculus TaxID=51337 RepID=A0A8C5P018_JACJA